MSSPPSKSAGKWIEWIRVRASCAALDSAMPSLEALFEEIEAATDGVETHFLRHALYDGDLAIVVVWHGRTEPGLTREGLLVAERLQRLGSVDHAVWVPADRKPITQPATRPSPKEIGI